VIQNDGAMVMGGAVSVGRLSGVSRVSGGLPGVRRVRRGVLVASSVLVVLLAGTACSSGGGKPLSAAAAGAREGGASGGSGSPSVSPTPVVKVPDLRFAGSKSKVSYLRPVKISVVDGSLVSMQVSAKSGGEEMDGQVSGDGGSWASASAPKPAASYRAVAQVKDSAGVVHKKSVTFTAASVPDSQRVSFTVTPGSGSTVGIGQPVVVRFLTPISRRAAMLKVMSVTGTTPGGKSVVGAWHWLNSQEVHWRPKEFWTPGTKVSVQMRIAGVKAGPDRYGRKDYSQSFTIGSSHVTQVDARSDRVKVYRDGKLQNTWPTGTGRKGLETYSGTYVVLGKAAVVQMDSCSARVTCDKKDPDYYDEKEFWATRITASGTFLHAAGWDRNLGQANTSHGCIHLSVAAAENFYNHAVPGDVVIVRNTGRGPQERINTQDPGLYDWNLPWSTWTAGSKSK
jgi:lipoprotein-anchoring transpeptidase ErfK/SrfK